MRPSGRRTPAMRDGAQHVLAIDDALAYLKQQARVPSATRVF